MLLQLIVVVSNSQSDSSKIAPIKDRSWLVAGIGVAGTAAAYGLLSEAWYSDTRRSNLHSFNDANEWKQIDKCGHFLTTYHIGMAGDKAFQWAGSHRNKALLAGGMMGSIFMTGIELLDGQSEEWGFSWSDMGANLAGSAFYIGQEALWQQQRITPKFSYRKSEYAQLRPDVFGANSSERWLKDYNGQVYWLSANLNSFGATKIPQWFNLALGYGADRMISGVPEAKWNQKYPWIKDSQREWYLSADLDLWRIQTNSKTLRSIFRTFSFIRIPLPALRFRQDGGFKLIPLI
jgi:uncharacterized protein YfiM (DUF2279 family)